MTWFGCTNVDSKISISARTFARLVLSSIM
jgi:hypothetical protein